MESESLIQEADTAIEEYMNEMEKQEMDVSDPPKKTSGKRKASASKSEPVAKQRKNKVEKQTYVEHEATE